MILVFCGTPEFAVPSLRALLAAGHRVPLVLTQPDRPAGRKMELHASPVKQLALEHGIEVLQPERLKRNQDLRSRLEAIAPDAILVVAYGRIIPDWMLSLPPFGNLNLHGSLLPKYRGAAPVQWAVANGETETGVTTMRLDAGLDTGDILLEHRIPIAPRATATELFTTLAEIGAALLLRTLEGLANGQIEAQSQDHALATLAPILTREDGRLRLATDTAQQTFNRWRGFYPWPGAWSTFRGKRFLVHRMHPAIPDSMIPGSVIPGCVIPGSVDSLNPGELFLAGDRLLIGAAAETLLELAEVQLEGKPRLSGQAFARDFQLRRGESLD